MSCKRKTCEYYKSCVVKRENDGTGCYDYKKSLIIPQKLKRKKRYSDEDVSKAMITARKYLKYSEMTWANVYIYTVPNKEIVEHLETLLNKKGVSLFG